MALNLNFSVEGEFITNMARDKLINQHDLVGAIKLLDSALVTDQLNELEKMGLMFKILQGSLSIVGTYPGDDYGVDETPENKEILASAVSKQGQKIKDHPERNRLRMAFPHRRIHASSFRRTRTLCPGLSHNTHQQDRTYGYHPPLSLPYD